MKKVKLLFKSPRFIIGLFILLLVLSFVLIYPMINRADPSDMIGMSFDPPGTETFSGHVLLLGSDNFGRDALLELVYGTKNSLLVGLIGGITATLIGLSIGLFAGYKGGLIDNILTAVTNMFIVIPSFIILILISVSLNNRSIMVTAIVIGLTGWPWTARAVRSQTSSLRNRDHVNIARITGYSLPRIIISQIMPYVASYVFMAFVLQVANSILQEAGLSMLGLGAFNTISLGSLMNWALMFTAPSIGAWWAFVPCALVISSITFSLYMMNSGMDEIFNPKIRS
jgi:peptide/nickel transport system permease protein